MKPYLAIKHVLMLLSVISLLATSGCQPLVTTTQATQSTQSTATSTENTTGTTATSTTGTTSTPTSAPTVAPTTAPTTASTTVPTTAPAKVEDYFPLAANVFSRYSGTGNEYVPMTVYVDYVWPGMIQLAYDNGGTEVHTLYTVGNGKVQVIQKLPELYVREDLSQLKPLTGGEILLQEPLVIGTTWQANGQPRTITALNVPITTKAGSFKAIEVTTAGPDATTRQYYAPGVGLVKMTAHNGYDITQELDEQKFNAVKSQTMTFYFPRMTQTDIEILYKEITVNYKTNTGLRELLTRYLRAPAKVFATRSYTVLPGDTLWSIALNQLGDGQKYRLLADLNAIAAPYTVHPGDVLALATAIDLPALLSQNTEINSVHIQPDSGLVTLDLTKNFVTEMNAGSGYEGAILHSIVNAVGHAYDAQKVMITLDGQPYESGHFALRPGEYFTVDYENMVRIE